MIMKRILTLVVSALLSLNGYSLKSNSLGGEAMQKTYKELAEIFDKYDIKGTTDQMIDDLEHWKLDVRIEAHEPYSSSLLF